MGVIAGCDYVLRLDDIHPPPPPPPDMVCDAAKTLCIDATEVTREAYAEFLAATNDDTSGQDPWCTWNTTYVPKNWPTPPGTEQRPVVNVDWCDAFAYCKWKHRRLCGRIGGGPVAPTDAADVTKSQWYFACTGGLQGQLYPYGDTYEPGACNDATQSAGCSVDVGQSAACQGGLPGMFDMTGNVYEWEDACDAASGAKDTCVLRGGDCYAPDPHTCAAAVGQPRSTSDYDRFGFRCCSDP